MGCRFVGETISSKEVEVSLTYYWSFYRTFKESRYN